MAKNDDNMLEREKGGSRVVTVLIALAIVAIWLIIFACLIKFDVGGIGSKVLYPALKDVPVSFKLKQNNALEITMKEIMVEGLLSIQAGENPRVIEEKLKSFLAPQIRNNMGDGDGGAAEGGEA